MKEYTQHRNSIFSQRLDRTTFTAYLLGAIVPLITLGVVVEHYVIPALSNKNQIFGMMGLVASIAILSFLSFLVLRKVTHSTLERIDRDNRRLSALLGASTNLTASEHASDIAATAVGALLKEMRPVAVGAVVVLGDEDGRSAELATLFRPRHIDHDREVHHSTST
ncbi:MAG: hypothetical protein IH827_09905 [Myxococcales bacterium]|nr:hypothetical protein [Myxococcales bacterium]